MGPIPVVKHFGCSEFVLLARQLLSAGWELVVLRIDSGMVEDPVGLWMLDSSSGKCCSEIDSDDFGEWTLGTNSGRLDCE